MTTYITSFVLEGEEIPIYRQMLEKWASTTEGNELNTVDRLIHNTFDASGETSARVEECLRFEIMIPFRDVMDAELKRLKAMREANLKLPRHERDAALLVQLMLLEQVIDKVRKTQMGSTLRR